MLMMCLPLNDSLPIPLHITLHHITSYISHIAHPSHQEHLQWLCYTYLRSFFCPIRKSLSSLLLLPLRRAAGPNGLAQQWGWYSHTSPVCFQFPIPRDFCPTLIRLTFSTGFKPRNRSFFLEFF